MINTVSLLGLFCVIVGYVMRYLIERRQFNRRNPYGMNEWRSFEEYKVYGFFEKKIRQVGWLIMAFGWVLIFITLFNYYNAKEHRDKQVQEAQQQAPKGHK